MATVSMKVFEHHKKDDGTYNVKICVQHKRKRKYLDTVHYVVRKQLTKDLKIRDPFVAEKVENQLRDYRKAISELESKLDFFTVETLIDYLRDKNEDIDFIKFCNEHIERLKKEGREGTSTTHRIVKIALLTILSVKLFQSMRFIQTCYSPMRSFYDQKGQ